MSAARAQTSASASASASAGWIIALCIGLVRLPCAEADAGAGADRGATGSVVIGGGAGDHARTVVAAAVAVAAREAGWSLPRVPMTQQDADRLLECGEPGTPWTCIPGSLKVDEVQRIFAFAVDWNQADNGAPMVVLTGRLIVTAPHALVVRQRFCEHCADDRLTEASIDLARQLLQDQAVRSGRTILEVESTPPGARITVDGQPLGATNATFNTFPGVHVVVVEKLGYRSAIRSVIAEEGRTATVAIALAPEPAATPPVRSYRRLAGTLIGGGALAAVAAGFLLELGTRGGPGRPDDKYRYRGATTAGAMIGVAGAAALTAGFYLWWRAPASLPDPGTGPGDRTGHGSRGLVAGWATAF